MHERGTSPPQTEPSIACTGVSHTQFLAEFVFSSPFPKNNHAATILDLADNYLPYTIVTPTPLAVDPTIIDDIDDPNLILDTPSHIETLEYTYESPPSHDYTNDTPPPMTTEEPLPWWLRPAPTPTGAPAIESPAIESSSSTKPSTPPEVEHTYSDIEDTEPETIKITLSKPHVTSPHTPLATSCDTPTATENTSALDPQSTPPAEDTDTTHASPPTIRIAPHYPPPLPPSAARHDFPFTGPPTGSHKFPYRYHQPQRIVDHGELQKNFHHHHIQPTPSYSPRHQQTFTPRSYLSPEPLYISPPQSPLPSEMEKTSPAPPHTGFIADTPTPTPGFTPKSGLPSESQHVSSSTHSHSPGSASASADEDSLPAPSWIDAFTHNPHSPHSTHQRTPPPGFYQHVSSPPASAAIMRGLYALGKVFTTTVHGIFIGVRAIILLVKLGYDTATQRLHTRPDTRSGAHHFSSQFPYEVSPSPILTFMRSFLPAHLRSHSPHIHWSRRSIIILASSLCAVIALLLSIIWYARTPHYDTTPTHMDLITMNPCSLSSNDFTKAHLPPMHVGYYDYPIRNNPPTVTNAHAIIGHVHETSCSYESNDPRSLMYIVITHLTYISGTMDTARIGRQMSDLSIQHHIGLHARNDQVYGKKIYTFTLSYAHDNFCLILIEPNLTLQGNHASLTDCHNLMQLAFNIADQAR